MKVYISCILICFIVAAVSGKTHAGTGIPRPGVSTFGLDKVPEQGDVIFRQLHAYEDGPELTITYIVNGKEMGVDINKKDTRAFYNCGFIKDPIGRRHCAKFFINPWSFNFISDYFEVNYVYIRSI